jgi:hypothetical protein
VSYQGDLEGKRVLLLDAPNYLLAIRRILALISPRYITVGLWSFPIIRAPTSVAIHARAGSY